MGHSRVVPLVVVLAVVVVACTDSSGGVASTQAPASSTSTTSASTSTAPAAPPGSTVAVTSTTLGLVSTTTTSSTSIAPAPSFPVDDELVWTVIAVDSGDVLNVREAPDAEAAIVGTVEPWSTDLSVSIETVDAVGRWRRAVADNGAEGWVNARFLVAQPRAANPDELAATADLVGDLVSWVRSSGGTIPDGWLADRALWIGGLGIYADGHNGWTWIPASDLASYADWHKTRRFLFFGEDCGSDCRKSVAEYLHFDRLTSDFSILIDDRAPEPNTVYIDGHLALAPPSFYRVVIDKPDPDPSNGLQWQRIHVVFDWSAGKPRLALIQTWGWTP